MRDILDGRWSVGRRARSAPRPWWPSAGALNPSRACPESVLGLSGVRHDQGLYFEGLQYRETSDAQHPAPPRSACPVIRQSVVKVASSTTSSVRRRRPPAFTGAAWHLASNAQAMLVPSHACLISGKGPVKLSWTTYRVDSCTVCRFLHGGT